MSNYLAIAIITAALRDILQDAAIAAVPGADVVLKRPETVNNDGQDKAAINLFLYQASPDPTWSNIDLPTRNRQGVLLRRPQLALNLDYLLSFHGSELLMEPQRLLGSVLTTLHAYPILEIESIRRAIDNYAYLAQGALFDQAEQVKLSLMNPSLEELSKLWSIFFQVPYTLSIVFRASPVFVEAQLETRNIQVVAQDGVKIELVPSNHTLVLPGQQTLGNGESAPEVP
jgi:hypothetical protein